jgi:hypothetical protein
MQPLGTNPDPPAAGLDELPGKSNYFIGDNPGEWRTDVPTYAKVRYKNIYSGIDLIYYGNQGQLEYDFVVAPGADPTWVRLGLDGTTGIHLDEHGNLVMETAVGRVRHDKPLVYQEIDGVRREIPAAYVVKDAQEFGFEVGQYELDRPLVIDPTLVYSTYLGGAGRDRAEGIAVDATGNTYVTGPTESLDFPTTSGAFDSTRNGLVDVFVAKLNATGSALLYSTYLGGSSNQEGRGIAVDSLGNAYVMGQTASPDFPTTPGVFDVTFNSPGQSDVFVTKLNATGSALLYSTYLGGSSTDFGRGIAVDASGNAHVVGTAFAPDFPTTPGAFDTSFDGDRDAFLTKLNHMGTALVYSTYIGGSSSDEGRAVAVDGAGNAYMTGDTGSADFPTTPGAFDTALNDFDAFVTKLDPTGVALVFSTYLGGAGGEQGFDITIDASENVYVTGSTFSPDFPTTAGAFDSTVNGTDAFVTKLNPAGSALVFSSYLGGSAIEEGIGIATDSSGNAYVAGITTSLDFPTTSGAFGPSLNGFCDTFVTQLDPTGSALLFSTFLGGSDIECESRNPRIATDSSGNAYVAGQTLSSDFPTTPGGFDTTFNGGHDDAFVAKIGVAVTEVDIDIRPGGDPNATNPSNQGLIPVAILTTEDFDAATVSPPTIQFGPGGASLAHRSGHLEDVDSDGDLDLVLHFHTQQSGIQCGDTKASLTGETFDGQAIQGSDSVVTVGCK